MSEIYDNWDRLVGRVIRHVKDRELCYQSSISSQTSDSNSASPRHHHHQLPLTAAAASVSPPETASSPPLGMSKFVYRVDLGGAETMKGTFKGGDLFRLIGICFAPNVRSDLLRKPRVIMKTISSINGVYSIGFDRGHKKLIVVGDLDPTVVVAKLRKLCCAEIISAIME